MRTLNDPLLTLTRIAEGAIHVRANEHTVGGRTVEQEITPPYAAHELRYGAIDETLAAKMIEANQMVEITVVVNRATGERICVFGVTVEEAAEKAVERICKLDHLKRRVTSLPVAVNVTGLLQQLVNRCSASVHFEMNEFKGKYWSFKKQKYIFNATAKDFLDDLKLDNPENFMPDDDDGSYTYTISPAERKAMEDLNQTLKVHFYPHTQVGYYVFYDTDLGDMLERAVELINHLKTGS